MATLGTERPEKLFGASEHGQHLEDKLCFIRCFLRQGLGGVGGSSFTRPSYQDDARQRYPDLVVASLGAQRKDKPGGTVSARVLFDGTHGITVNTRIRIRDQERGPNAADLKRIMREKSRVGVPTFALTADVSEAHRQIPVAEQDWHPRVSSGSWWFSLHQHSGYVWRRISTLLLVTCCLSHRSCRSEFGRQISLHVAHVGC